MKINQIKKIFLTLVAFFLLNGCSRALELVWTPETSDFTISANPTSANVITVSINRTDHNGAMVVNGSSRSSAFRGYLIYISTESPYEAYTLNAIDTEPNGLGGFNVVTNDGGTLVADSTQAEFSFTGCSSDQLYYFRVVSAKQDWNGSAFSGETEKIG